MIPSTYMEAHISNFKILDAELWLSEAPSINMVNGDVCKENIRTHKRKFKVNCPRISYQPAILVCPLTKHKLRAKICGWEAP